MVWHPIVWQYPMAPRSPVTLKDVASAAKVDLATASRVMSGRTGGGRVSIARIKQVQAVAEKLGYRPNAASRAIRGGRFNAIGLLCSTVPGTGISGGIIHGLMETLAERDIHLTMAQVPDEDLMADTGVPRLVREWAVDALLINYAAGFPADLVEAIDKLTCPALWLNVKLPGRCIHPDDYGAARDATRQLIEAGHRRILYDGMVYPKGQGHYSFADRWDAYATTMREAGLIPEHCYSDRSDQMRLELVSRLRKADDRPTAVVSSARSGLMELLAAQDLGLKVPRDLSIIALRDPSILSSWDSCGLVAGVDVTALEVPVYEIGHRAARVILDELKKPRPDRSPIVMPFDVHPGRTVAPPPEQH